MKIQLKKIFLEITLKLIAIIKFLAKYLKLILILALKPFSALWQFIFKPIILRAYKIYLKFKTKLDKSPIIKNKVGFLLYNRNVVYVVVLIITVFVSSTNILLAKDTKREDVAMKSNLYKLIAPKLGAELDEDITEKANNKKTKKNYIDLNTDMVATIPVIAKKEKTAGNLMLLGDHTTLASTTVLQNEVSKNRSGITEYEIQEGDSISTIADRFGITVNTLYWANSLTSSSTIQPGKTLKIPPASGIIHKVVSGDTLDSIIKKYNGNKEETIKYNNINSDELVAVGAELLIAQGTPPPPPAPTPSNTSTMINNSWGNFFTKHTTPSVTGGKLNWPIGCHPTPTTYWGHPNRARDFPCPVGTPIYAAESGTITISFTGQWGHGYGNAIDLHSANGLMTRYAHMSSFNVSNGQYVNRGDVIGFNGMTGRTTGPHLHFEVWLNGVAYDPINYVY